MKRAAFLIVAIAAGCSGEGAGPVVEGEEPLIAFRLAYEEEAAGRTPLVFDDRAVFVVERPLISDDDLMAVEVSRQGQEVILAARMTAEAGERFEKATAEHVGRWIAVYYDGEIVSLPVVRSAVGGSGPVLLPAPASEQAAEIARKVRARWPADQDDRAPIRAGGAGGG